VNFIVVGDRNLPEGRFLPVRHHQAVLVAKEIKTVVGRATLVHYTEIRIE
jgi:hypothetical protein